MELKFKVRWLENKIVFIFLFLQVGEEFDETTPDGRETKAIVTFEDGKIVTVQTAKKAGQKSTRVGTDFSLFFSILIFHIQSVREMTGPDQMLYTMMIEGSGVVCKQTFKRI